MIVVQCTVHEPKKKKECLENFINVIQHSLQLIRTMTELQRHHVYGLRQLVFSLI